MVTFQPYSNPSDSNSKIEVVIMLALYKFHYIKMQQGTLGFGVRICNWSRDDFGLHTLMKKLKWFEFAHINLDGF